MEEFATGDTVRLKSGGPLMTVEGAWMIGGRVSSVSCTWFTEDGKAHDHCFRPEVLRKA